MKESGRGYTGHMLEHENLGEMTKEGKERYEKFKSMLDYSAPIMDVVRVVESCQREEAINPRRYFSRNLRKEIAKQLNLDLEENPYSVEFYVAVGTLLDSKFGTDAFVRIKEPGTKFNGLVTIDITENDHKDRSKKVNVTVAFPGGSLDETNREEKEKLDLIITNAAQRICQFLERVKDHYFTKAS